MVIEKKAVEDNFKWPTILQMMQGAADQAWWSRWRGRNEFFDDCITQLAWKGEEVSHAD